MTEDLPSRIQTTTRDPVQLTRRFEVWLTATSGTDARVIDVRTPSSAGSRATRTSSGLTIRITAELFSDLARELLSLNAMTVANTIERTSGSYDDLSAWDVLWRSLLTGWPV